MRKSFFVILLFILSLPISAQFTLIKEGFINSTDNSKSYVVFDFENLAKENLYLNVLKFITQKYKSAKDVVSEVENEVITVNAVQAKQINCKTLDYDIQYTLSVSFKDNKIKIDSPVFNCYTYNGKPYRLTMSGSNGGFGSEVTVGLFKKDGKPGQKKTIEDIEKFINELCASIVNAASGSNDNW